MLGSGLNLRTCTLLNYCKSLSNIAPCQSDAKPQIYIKCQLKLPEKQYCRAQLRFNSVSIICILSVWLENKAEEEDWLQLFRNNRYSGLWCEKLVPMFLFCYVRPVHNY